MGAIGATGIFTAVFGVWSAPRAVAASMLPPGLGLAPQNITGPDEHPVVFLLGREWDVSVHVGPFKARDCQYLEFLLAVPFVARKSGTTAMPGPFVFMPRLFLDNWPFVVAGWFYGYAKRRARVQSPPDGYGIQSLLLGTPSLSARFEDRGPWGPVGDYPNASHLTPVFHLPFVGRGPFGSFIYSDLDFHMDRSRIQPVAAQIRIEASFARGVPPGSHSFPGIDQSSFGAFRIEVPWTLGPPSWA